MGTTVAPWQLFFQQSNVIDKRITPRFIGYERADTTVGAVVVVAGAIAVEVVAVFAVRGTHLAGHFTDALGVLLPSAAVFLLLLCNDPEVLGPWVSPPWLNILAGVIIGVLLTLSGTLVVSTVFPSLNVIDVAGGLAIALILAGGGAALGLERGQRSGRSRRRG